MSEEVETQEEVKEEAKPIAGIGTLVFGKYDATEVVCRDPGLAPYINLSQWEFLILEDDTLMLGSVRLVCQLQNDLRTN